MLGYRHAFHAGNFADVFKHALLVQIIFALRAKAKPFCVIDTHAGAGLYDLGSESALKNREFDVGDRPALVSSDTALRAEFAGDSQVAVHLRDGCLALQALVSPVQRRGLVTALTAIGRLGPVSSSRSGTPSWSAMVVGRLDNLRHRGDPLCGNGCAASGPA